VAARVKPQYVVRVKTVASNNLKKTAAALPPKKNTFLRSVFVI